jgi:hypothetical protein
MAYERFLDKNHPPSENEIAVALGAAKELWLDIHNYIERNYDFDPELTFFTKKYGWSIRYRRSKKTLCYLFPEKDAFSALIVLGRKEAERIDVEKDRLNETVRSIFENTEQFHDGRWMWIRIKEISDIASIKLLLAAKKKPKFGSESN